MSLVAALAIIDGRCVGNGHIHALGYIGMTGQAHLRAAADQMGGLTEMRQVAVGTVSC